MRDDVFPSRHKPASKTLTPIDAAVIKRKLLNGELQSRIAADFDVNQGRISEINKGKKFKDVAPIEP